MALLSVLWNADDVIYSHYGSCSRTTGIATFTYTVVTLNQPLYLTHLLAPNTPSRSLQSQDKHLLLQPAVSTAIGSRGFSYAAPSIWNKLSVEIRNKSSFVCLERNLKTYAYYFSRAFS